MLQDKAEARSRQSSEVRMRLVGVSGDFADKFRAVFDNGQVVILQDFVFEVV